MFKCVWKNVILAIIILRTYNVEWAITFIHEKIEIENLLEKQFVSQRNLQKMYQVALATPQDTLG